MRKCFLKSPFWLNELLHCEHMYLFPLWVCLWQEMPLLFTNALGHWSQNFWSAIFCFKLFPLTLFHNDWGNHLKINFNSWSITFTFTAHIVFFLIMILTGFCQRKGRFLVTFFLKSKRRFGILRKYGWNSLSISILPIQSQCNLLTYQLGTKIARSSTLLEMDQNLENKI